jgi:hypothetical protein
MSQKLPVTSQKHQATSQNPQQLLALLPTNGKRQVTAQRLLAMSPRVMSRKLHRIRPAVMNQRLRRIRPAVMNQKHPAIRRHGPPPTSQSLQQLRASIPLPTPERLPMIRPNRHPATLR